MSDLVARRITARGIIIDDNGRIFAQRLKKNNAENDFWCTPGGGLETRESIKDGLVRELIEETGVRPEVGKLLYVQQYVEKRIEFLEFFFEITNSRAYKNIDLTSTSHGELEIAQYGFIHVSDSYILPQFLQRRDIQRDIAEGNTRFFDYLAEN